MRSQREDLQVQGKVAAALPVTQPAHCIFEAQAKRRPDAVAITSGAIRISYKELNEQSNKLARVLIRAGVEPETLVGVVADRSVETVVSILGVLKAGGAYLPLDPEYPLERLDYMIGDANARLILVKGGFANTFRHEHVTLLNLSELQSDGYIEENTDPPQNVRPDNLAYVIYTSGSTGNPKGVMVEHHSLSDYVKALGTALAISECDRYLHFASFCFSASVRQLFLPLCHGATVTMAPSEDRRDPLALLDLIKREKITVLDTFPSFLRSILRSSSLNEGKRKAALQGHELRLIATTSEPLSAQLCSRIHAELSNSVPIVNMYGQTETCGIITTSTFADQPPDDDTLSVGSPLPTATLHVLDDKLCPAPVDTVGEIYISGSCVARGYLNQTELTNESFIVNPSNANERLYKTGDLAIFRSDGNLKLVGRADHQVKVRGFRINLTEIEQVISRHPEVEEVVVSATDTPLGEKALTAHVVTAKKSLIESSELSLFLRERFPDYAVPSNWCLLERLPTLPNGKVDRPALTALRSTGEGAKHASAQSEDMLEFALTRICERLLNVEGVTPHDNFFELGGDSLLAACFFAEIEALVGRPMPLATLFRAPTISHLASLLRKEAEINLWPSLVAIKPDGSKPPLFCVHGVGGNVLTYYSLTKFLDPDRPLYGIQARGLDGKHHPSECLEEIADRYVHDIRAFQPEGPYFIGGYSFGGWVAFEMARQLDRIGQRVAVLALFDPRITFESRNALSGQRMWAIWGRRVSFHARKLLQAENKLDYIQRRIRTIRRRYNSRRWRAGAENQPSIPLAQRNVTEACWKALRNYIPSPYKGKVTLFRSSTESSIFRDPIEEWGELGAGGLEICQVPGTHLDIFQEPFVKALADELNVRLQRTDIESIF